MGRNKNKKKKWNRKIRASKPESAVARAWERPGDTSAEKDAADFSLRIPEWVHDKIMYWINKASPNEVSGFGTLEFNEDTREFTVVDAMLLKQEVSGGSAEIDDEALNRAMFQMRDIEGALKWHWHSHPTFGVFWSGTDEELIRQLGRPGWIVATVFNCKRESRTAFLTSVDLMGKPHDVFIDNFATIIVKPLDLELEKRYDAEFDANVKEARWKYHKSDYKSPYTPPGSEGNRDDDTRGGVVRLPEAHVPANRIWPAEYDSYGYATAGSRTVYNPCYDDDIIGEDGIFLMIDDMEQSEIEWLRERCPLFATHVRNYIIAKATAQREHYNESGVEV